MPSRGERPSFHVKGPIDSTRRLASPSTSPNSTRPPKRATSSRWRAISPGSIDRYQGALDLYGGDLAFGSDIKHIVERERLRSRHLSVLAGLAENHFADGNFARALEGALQLLAQDPCREDAHRMAMRCFVRLGARAQALRQYRTCRAVLQMEFDAIPERLTEQLYEVVRVEPWRV